MPFAFAADIDSESDAASVLLLPRLQPCYLEAGLRDLEARRPWVSAVPQPPGLRNLLNLALFWMAVKTSTSWVSIVFAVVVLIV